jgi:hypothetical protein
LEHVQIHDTDNGHLHEKEGVVHSLFHEGAKHVHLLAVVNMFQGDIWIFAALDPAVVGIDLTTNMRSSLKITESRNFSSSCIQ